MAIIHEEFDPPPTWLVMEVNMAKPVSLKALEHSPIQPSTLPYNKNRIVKFSLRISVQFKRHFGFQLFSTNTPLVANVFSLSSVDSAFVKWSNLGIKKCNDLYFANVFASFKQLSDKFSIPKVDYSRFLLVRSFVHNTFHVSQCT